MNLGVRTTFDIGDGRMVTIETGKLAKQADGAAVVTMGNTMILATVCCKKEAVEGMNDAQAADYFKSLPKYKAIPFAQAFDKLEDDTISKHVFH